MKSITLNKFGVFVNDVFLLNYYGILTFFQVAKTTENYVYLVELATTQEERGISIDKHLKTTKNPKVVLTNNVRSKTKYKVIPLIHHFEPVLPIEVEENSILYKEVYAYVDYPEPGTYYAYKVNDYIDCCWISEEVDSIPNA